MSSKPGLLLLLTILLLWSPPLQAQSSIQTELILVKEDPNFGNIICKGLDVSLLSALQLLEVMDLRKSFKVVPAGQSNDQLPGMLGTYTLKEEAILFKPRLPLIEGRNYDIHLNVGMLYSLAEMAFDPTKFPEEVNTIITVPNLEERSPTIVQQFYPSATEWPANILKCYIHFSASMSLEPVYPHIRLLDEKGQDVEVPFLELHPELWDAERKRLTLWFDPGRIKSHLTPNRERGNPLVEGKQYTIVVDSTLKDRYGQSLENTFLKPFVTVAPDRTKPEFKNWRMISPFNNSFTALELHFPESMDQAVLRTIIGVFDEQGRLMKGKVSIDQKEKRWSFVPAQRWKKGSYHLKIGNDLEDLAGNNLERLFDEEVESLNLNQASPSGKIVAFVSLPFQVE